MSRLCFAIAVLIAAGYFIGARPGSTDRMRSGVGQDYYNLLVRGLEAGHLWLAQPAPEGLARLRDPYDPAANAPYRLGVDGVHDLSYWRGRLYLYFGITPVLALFWPYAALTGQFLSHAAATAAFASGVLLAGAALLAALARRIGAGAGSAALAVVALGLGAGLPLLLARAEVYEVAIAAGLFFEMIALAALWRALERAEGSLGWLALAGTSFGLALGARPSLLPAAAALLVPIWAARAAGPGRLAAAALSALGPVAVCGVALLAYNRLRFGSALDFGLRSQLASVRPAGAPFFGVRYLGFDLRALFFQAAGWTRHFPFVRLGLDAVRPAGAAAPEDSFGALTDAPFVWLALAAPLSWRRAGSQGPRVRRFALALALAFAGAAAPLALYFFCCARYEAEFLVPLVLLAGLGLFGLDRALAGGRGLKLARVAAIALLAFTGGFGLCAAVAHQAAAESDYGLALAEAGRSEEAIRVLRDVVALSPDLAAAHTNLGDALMRTGRTQAGMEEFAEALRLDPNQISARENLADGLVRSGRLADAAGQYERVIELQPSRATAWASLGYALAAEGRIDEAIDRYRRALVLAPGDERAHNGLGVALARAGRLAEARAQFEAALRLAPDDAEASANLARVRALEISGGGP